MSFMTDAGVFSKKMVDYGSQVLLKTFILKKGHQCWMLAVVMDQLV